MAVPDELAAYKALHDRLLNEKPADAVHDPAECPLCAMTDDTTGGKPTDDTRGGSMSTTTHTDEELKAAVDAAVAPHLARIKDLEASQQTSEVDAAVAAAKAELEGQIAELQTQLDAKVLEAQTEKERADGITAWLDEEKVKAEQAALVDARKSERIDKVKEVASFPQEYLDANADRFAAMSDEDFEVALEGWKAISKPEGSGGGGGDHIPDKTGLHAARDETTNKNGKTSTAVKELIGSRRNGRVDLSSL